MTCNDWSISAVCFWHHIVYIAQADLFSKESQLGRGHARGELSFFKRVIEGHSGLSRWKNE